jgi:hypothetical protein
LGAKALSGKAWHGRLRSGPPWLGEVWAVNSVEGFLLRAFFGAISIKWSGLARIGMARYGQVRRGLARQGMGCKQRSASSVRVLFGVITIRQGAQGLD